MLSVFKNLILLNFIRIHVKSVHEMDHFYAYYLLLKFLGYIMIISTILLMDPPHIIIFLNQKCPVKKMSKDRWRRYEINAKTKKLQKTEKRFFKLCPFVLTIQLNE